MANKKTDMSKLRQILRLHAQGERKLEISELTGVSRNTLKKYLKIYLRLGLTPQDIEGVSDKELDELFGENLLPEPGDKYKTLEAIFPTIEKEPKRRGITRQILWERYISAHPDGYRLSQFKHHYQQWLKRSKPIMHIEHIAGDKMFIDFAGEKLHIVNMETGEITEAEVFISVLGASQLTYVEAVLSQCKEDFISCYEHALTYYDRVPKAIVPDNLKSAVIKSSHYEPTLNQVFKNFALHYSTTILHKTRFSGRPYSRRDLFEEIERETLTPLPSLVYEFKRQQYSTVSVNGHICLKEDKHYYSVPYGYIGKKVKVMVTTLKVKTQPSVLLLIAFFYGRGGRIRTCDPLVPNQMHNKDLWVNKNVRLFGMKNRI